MKTTPLNNILLEILVAIGFLNLSFSFLLLDLILPLIAYGLLIFDLYKLVSYGPLFKKALLLTFIKAMLFITSMSLSAGRLYLEYDEIYIIIGALNLFLNLLLFILIYKAFIKLCEKDAKSLISAYIVWYIFLTILALLNYHGLLIPLFMVISLALILYKSYCLFKKDLLISYASFKTPVLLICILSGAMILGIFINHYFFARSSYDYQVFINQDIAITKIDDTVTNDLLKEDLDYLQKTEDINVLVESEDFLNVKTLIADLGDEKYIIHYLSFSDMEFYGSEYIRVDPLATAYDIHMVPLCDKDDKTYYEDIKEYAIGENESFDFEFSFFKNSTDQRAYIAYKVSEDDELLHNGTQMISFIHQTSPFNYPYVNAKMAADDLLDHRIFRLAFININ